MDTTIWLRPAEAACAGCAPTPAGAVCSGSDGSTACEQPALAGDLVAARRVLKALRRVPFEPGGPDLVAAGQVRGLQVVDGEAELTLAFPRGCGSRKLAAEGAFDVLRRLLPDTDVYVRHAG